jgi:tetratricopeptide (TPR) repeat protein
MSSFAGSNCLNAVAASVNHRQWKKALREINVLPIEMQCCKAALALKIQILNGLEDWESLETTAMSLALEYPADGCWFVAWARAKRHLGSALEARELLLSSLVETPDHVDAIYQLAQYACLLGDHAAATEFTRRALRLDTRLNSAKSDPSLLLIPDSSRCPQK